MKLQKIRDAWQNLLTGLGTSQDRTLRTSFLRGCTKTESELTAIYRHNWLARRVVDALPQRALARGVSEKTPWPASYAEINFANEAWPEGAFLRAASLGRLYGGSGLYLGFNQGEDLTQPAPPSARAEFVDVFSRFELQCAKATAAEKGVPQGQRERWPGQWREENPASALFGQPLVWELAFGTNPRKGLRFHHSRMIRFSGTSKPPEATAGEQASSERGALDDRDWSDSVLLSVWEDIQRYGVFWQNVDQLISVGSVGWLKMRGLFEALSTENADAIRARVDVFNQSLSTARLMMLDSDGNEEYGREAVSFAGVAEVLQELQLATAGAVKQPVTELFGRAPAGMNATGESDLQNWDSEVTGYQKRQLQPRASRYASALQGSPVAIEFPPVRVPSEAEVEEQRAKRIGATERLWAMGAFSDQEIRDAQRAGVPVEQLPGLKKEVPPDPTRAVVQVKSSTEVE